MTKSTLVSRLVPALLLRHCDHLGHLDQLTVLPDLLAALLLLDHAAIFPGHKIHDGIEDSVAHAVGDGQAPLLKDCVDYRLLNGVADGARLVPTLLLQLRLTERSRDAGKGGRDSQQQQAQNLSIESLVTNDTIWINRITNRFVTNFKWGFGFLS